jgi:putative SOS response-associated peptidase YedK
MCATFIIIPQDELDRIISDVQNNLKAEHANVIEAYKKVYAKAEAPVIIPNRGQYQIQTMLWGYPVSWQKGVVYNTRIETALGPKSGIWSDSIRSRRCLVPSYGFFEPHMTDTHPSAKTGKPIKDQYFFKLPDSDIAWMAGVYEDGHFSIVTTVPNQWMREIHPRMPVVLRPDELDIWLSGEFYSLANRENIPLESSKVA